MIASRQVSMDQTKGRMATQEKGAEPITGFGGSVVSWGSVVDVLKERISKTEEGSEGLRQDVAFEEKITLRGRT